MWIKKNPILAVLGALGLFVALNLVVAGVSGLRLDLTQEKLFTLSDGSEKLLQEMKDRPIEVTLYFSSELGREVPAYGAFAGRVRDMLNEFEAVSGGGVILREVDPKPFSPEEDEAVANGLEGLPVDAGGDKVYFGLSAVYADEAEAARNTPSGEGLVVAGIPFFQAEREQFLEYDLMKTLYTVSNPDLPVVGIITEAPLMGDPYASMQGRTATPWAVIGQAGDFFDFEEIFEPRDFLDVNPDILLVAHPGNLRDDMQYAIEQFMMRGGKAVFLMDPWFESKGNGYAPDRSDGSAEKIFTKWGIRIEETKVVGDREIAHMVNGGKDGTYFPAPYIPWLKPPQQNLNQSDPILADINDLIIPSAGAISLAEGSALSMETLITTTDQARLIEIKDLRQPDVMALLDGYEADENAPFTIAARLSGPIETAFPDGPPPLTEEQLAELEERQKEAEENGETLPEDPPRFPEHLATSEGSVNIILMADADFMADRFWVQVQDFFGQQVMMPFGDNGSFMLGMLESLNGSGELMSLRSRGITQRPFTLIEDMRNKAEEQFRSQQQEIAARLQEVEQKLNELRSSNVNDANLVGEANEEVEKTISEFTASQLELRRELRSVNLALREDIESLEGSIRFVNIALVPALLIIFAVIAGLSRRRRYR
ncbi:MAG: Gldg family protein [Alphaproteobacteria bacterium]|nr:Gldg family protein [Alphaproteobacteria bacterium]